MRNKRKNRVFLLILLVLGISIGFATLATTLQINGTSGIGKNTWSIYWDNIRNVSGVSATEGPSILADADNNPRTLLTWKVKLNKPGDYFEFEVDAVNAGTIDAMVTNYMTYIDGQPIEFTENGEIKTNENSPLPPYLTYTITYADGEPVQIKNLLKKATIGDNDEIIPTRDTYKIRVEYDADKVTNDDINEDDDDDDEYEFTADIDYGQDDGTGKDRNYPSLKIGDYFVLVPDANEYYIPKSVTGYSSNQRIVPSDVRLWVVIDIKGDGNFEAVSYYVTDEDIHFNTENIVGYQNYVQVLQDTAHAYEKAGYTVDARAMGFNGQTLKLPYNAAVAGQSTEKPFEDSTPMKAPEGSDGAEYHGGVGGDTLAAKDLRLVRNAVGRITAAKPTFAGANAENTNGGSLNITYFIASRYAYVGGGNNMVRPLMAFGPRQVGPNGEVEFIPNGFTVYQDWDCYGYCTVGWKFNDMNYGFRPIITVRKDVKIASGKGTGMNPYRFE